jgi:hypothetical protein
VVNCTEPSPSVRVPCSSVSNIGILNSYQLVVVLGAGDAQEPGQALSPRLAVAKDRRPCEPGVMDHPRYPENKFTSMFVEIKVSFSAFLLFWSGGTAVLLAYPHMTSFWPG